MRKKLLSMLVLLMVAVTGAWAQEETLLTTISSYGGNASFTSGSKTFKNIATVTFSGEVYNDGDEWGWNSFDEQTLTVTAAEGYTITRVKFYTDSGSAFDEEAPFEAILVYDKDDFITKVNGTSIGNYGVTKIEVYGYAGTPAPATYNVTFKEGTEDATSWQGKAGEGAYQALPLEGVAAGTAVTVKYNGTKKVKSVKVVKKAAPAEEPVTQATPLTIEALTAGTVTVNMNGELSTGMKYSVNGGTKTTIYNTTNITVAKGDKVQFYGNGTSTQAYGNTPEVSIQGSGDGFQTKVYGNIMSLLDEEGFATKTDLPNAEYVFYQLFKGNTTLNDASELLLPAATLAADCYNSMFFGCTNLTTAPKLPATTLAASCYIGMFYGCTSLTTAYVKAAYTQANDECATMFNGCTATGAVLHTTSGSKANWETKMGTGKTWSNWTVADDWQE